MADNGNVYQFRLANNLGESGRGGGGLKPPGGDGTSGGMDAWQQTVETRLAGLQVEIGKLGERLDSKIAAETKTIDAKIDSRFLWLLGAFAAGFLTVAGLILTRTDAVTDKLGAKIDAFSQQVGTTNDRVSRLEGRFDATSPPPAQIAKRRP